MSELIPTTCKNSIDMGGVYVCRLQALPCALHQGKRCYLQAADEAVKVMAEAIREVEE